MHHLKRQGSEVLATVAGHMQFRSEPVSQLTLGIRNLIFKTIASLVNLYLRVP